MAKPTTFPEEHVREPITYRRLSGFAITSLAFAAFFAVCIVVAALWGMRDRSPLLLPIWVQALPVIGALLALTAMYLIRNSEGTLAGMKLAVWGWWLSVVFGLGYWAYSAATYFAVTHQADKFVLTWFDELKQGEAKIGYAFMDMQDPANRKKINPEDHEKINTTFSAQMNNPREGVMRAALDIFRAMPITHLLAQGGPNTQIEPLAVKSWDFKNGAYQVKRIFRVTTEEGINEIEVLTQGLESKSHEFEGRQWQVMNTETKIIPERYQPLPLGSALAKFRQQSEKFLDAWGAKLTGGNLGGAYADTLEPAERDRLLVRNYSELIAAGLAASAVPVQGVPGGPLAGCLPGLALELVPVTHRLEVFSVIQRQGFITSDKLVAAEDKSKEAAIKVVNGLFGAGLDRPRFMNFQTRAESGRRYWKVNNERLQLAHDCKLGYFSPPQPAQQIDVTVVVESDPGPLDPARHPQWRVVGMELVGVMDSQGPGGMPNPSMARGMTERRKGKGKMP